MSKFKFSLFLLLFLLNGSVQALTIDPSSTVVGALFNFQTVSPDITLGPNSFPGVGSEPLPLVAIGNPAISITGAGAGFIVAGNYVEGDAIPWLDGPTGTPARPAGLGVCQDLSDGCGGEPTDNIEAFEGVELIVNTPIFIGDIWFRDGNHELNFADGATFGVSIDGGAFMPFLFSAVVDGNGVFSGLATTLITSSIVFANLGGADPYAGEKADFYVSGFGAAVPIPAALPLFISGLLGFAFFSRKTVLAKS